MHVVPKIYYQGAYPTARLVDGEHGGFQVKVKTFLWAPVSTSGTLRLTATWGATAELPVKLPKGNSSHDLELEAAAKERLREGMPCDM